MKYNSTDALEWQRIWSQGGYDFGLGVAVNGSSAVYVAGTIATGGDNGTGFLLKFDDLGNLIWQRGIHGQSQGVAVDRTGSIYVVGDLVRIGGIFLVKFNSTGTLLWEKDWIGTGQGNAITVDYGGDIYITGWINGSGVGVGNLWLAKFDSSGTVLWQKTWEPSSNYDAGYGLAIDNSTGDVYLTGVNEADLLACGANIQILKINSAGNLLWQEAWGCKEYDIGTAIAVDQSTHLVYVTGTFRDGGGPVLLRLAPSGALLASKILEPGGVGNGVAIDPFGGTIIAGQIERPPFDCLKEGNDTLESLNLRLQNSSLSFENTLLGATQEDGNVISPPQSFVTLGGLDALLLHFHAVTTSLPTAPTNVIAKGASGMVGLSWQVPQTNGTSPVMGYNIYRSKTPGCESLEPVSSAIGTSYTDMNLINGQTYYYQIAAFNDEGEGPRSSFVYTAPLTPVKDYSFNLEGSNFMIETNATLIMNSFHYEPTANQVSFHVSGEAGSGFTNITVPKPLIINASSVSIALNGSSIPFLMLSGQKNFYLYSSFSQGNYTMSVSLGEAPASLNPALYFIAIFGSGLIFGGVVAVVVSRIRRNSISGRAYQQPSRKMNVTGDCSACK